MEYYHLAQLQRLRKTRITTNYEEIIYDNKVKYNIQYTIIYLMKYKNMILGLAG